MRPVTLTLAKNYTDKKIQESDGGSTSQSVQADWNQNDQSAPDYIKNRIAWVEPGTTTTYTFDGNLEGKEYIYLEEESTDAHKYYLVKIADEAISLDDFEALELYTGIIQEVSKNMLSIESMGTSWAAMLGAIILPVIVSAEGVEAFGSTLFGTYVLYGTEQIGGIDNPALYTSVVHCSTPEIVHKLEPKYLPEGGFGYEEPSTILGEYQLGDSGGGVLQAHIGLEAGKIYTVTLDSGTYTAVCKSFTSEIFGKEITSYYIGNFGRFSDNDTIPDTGETFLVADTWDNNSTDVFEISMAFDYNQGTKCIVSSGGAVHKIDPKFLPEGIGYKDEDEKVLSASLSPESSGMGLRTYGEISLTNGIPFVVGETYIVKIDSGEYEVVAEGSEAQDIKMVSLGSSQVETAVSIEQINALPYPFFIGCLSQNDFVGALIYDGHCGSSIEVRKPGKIHTIPSEYLPMETIEEQAATAALRKMGGDKVSGKAYTFDGKIDGKEYIEAQPGMTFVKVSNEICDPNMIESVILVTNNESKKFGKEDFLLADEDGTISVTVNNAPGFAIVPENYNDFLDRGIWIIYTESDAETQYVSKIQLTETIHPIDEKFLPEIDAASLNGKTSNDFALVENLEEVKEKANLFDSCKYLILELLDSIIYTSDKSETISQLKQLLKDLSIKISEIGFGTTSFIEDAGLQINRDTVKGRATLIPVGQYLRKGRTYRFSIGEAKQKYSYGIQIMQASNSDLVFECPLGETKYFNNVTSRLVDTGWMINDYQYTATEDNQIFTMNFKITVDGDFTADDYATLLANVVVEEVL